MRTAAHLGARILFIAYDIWLDIRLSSAKARSESGILNCIAKVATFRGDRYRSNGKYYSKIPHCFHTKFSVVLSVVKQIIGHGQVTWRKPKPLLSCVASIFEIFKWVVEWVKPEGREANSRRQAERKRNPILVKQSSTIDRWQMLTSFTDSLVDTVSHYRLNWRRSLCSSRKHMPAKFRNGTTKKDKRMKKARSSKCHETCFRAYATGSVVCCAFCFSSLLSCWCLFVSLFDSKQNRSVCARPTINRNNHENID